MDLLPVMRLRCVTRCLNTLFPNDTELLFSMTTLESAKNEMWRRRQVDSVRVWHESTTGSANRAKSKISASDSGVIEFNVV